MAVFAAPPTGTLPGAGTQVASQNTLLLGIRLSPHLWLAPWPPACCSDLPLRKNEGQLKRVGGAARDVRHAAQAAGGGGG